MTSLKTLIALVLCFTGFVFALGHSHKCIHNEISEAFPPVVNEILSETEKQYRLMQSLNFRPIKIIADTSALVGLTEEQKEIVLSKVLPVTIDFLSSRIEVPYSGAPLKLKPSKCRNLAIPLNYKNEGVDADLVIFVTSSNEPDGQFIAWASSCVTDSVTGRPIAGQINYNVPYISGKLEAFEEQVDTSIHEMVHVLGFSKSLYSSYRKGLNSTEILGGPNVVQTIFIRGQNRTVIKSPKILEIARSYYNCSDVKGIEVENEGQAGTIGSHWERTILNNEVMTASSIIDASFSVFTLALLQDSGWYRVDFSKAEPFFFGANAGCEFLEYGCLKMSNRREFCSPEANKSYCNFNFKHKGYCKTDSHSDGCSYVQRYSNSNCENPLHGKTGNARGETYGKGSKCVIGSIITKKYSVGAEYSLCYNYTCTDDGKIKFLPTNGDAIVCEVEGALVKATGSYGGGIRCPNPADFCKDYYPECLNSCSAKGYCVRGRCECRAGFTGEDCSVSQLA